MLKTKFKIEKNIPIPRKGHTKKSYGKWLSLPVNKMDVGNSIIASPTYRYNLCWSVRQGVNNLKKKYKIEGRRFAVRKNTKGQTVIIRIS